MNRKYSPNGIVDYASNIHKKSTGEHVDAILSLSTHFAGAKAMRAKARGKSRPSVFGSDHIEMQPLKPKNSHGSSLTNPSHYEPLPSRSNSQHSGLRNRYPNRDSSPSASSTRTTKTAKTSTKKKFQDLAQRALSFLLLVPPIHDDESGEEYDDGYTCEVDNTDRIQRRPQDLRNPVELARALDMTGLSEEHMQKIGPDDFREINDLRSWRPKRSLFDCFFCSLAALKRKTASELLRETLMIRQHNGPISVEYIVDLYKQAGFSDTKKIFEGTPEQFYQYLDDNIQDREIVRFHVAFVRGDGSVHVVHTRAWKNGAGDAFLLTIDFEQPPFSQSRYTDTLPKEAVTVYIISPLIIRVIDGGARTEVNPSPKFQARLDALLRKQTSGNKCSKRIIGYLASWSLRPFSLEQSLSLTILIYAFVEMEANGHLSLPSQTISRERLLDAYIARKFHAEHGLRLKLTFVIGGWENSQHFSRVLANGQSRSIFISEIDRIIQQYHFDGVDIDWEYPITGGATSGIPEDKDNYVTFLRELRARLGPNRLISIAAAAGTEALAGFDIPRLLEHVDWIGVMSYDFFGAWDSKWGAYVGPLAPLRRLHQSTRANLMLTGL